MVYCLKKKKKKDAGEPAVMEEQEKSPARAGGQWWGKELFCFLYLFLRIKHETHFLLGLAANATKTSKKKNQPFGNLSTFCRSQLC